MTIPLIEPERAETAQGPFLVAVRRDSDQIRLTGPHRHARGQLLGSSRGLLTVVTDEHRWVVPAISAVWIPPHHIHALQSHGPFSGWSVYVSEKACRSLPRLPLTMPFSALLREAIHRAATWPDEPFDRAKARIASVILDEVRSLPSSRDFGLPMPGDPRLLRIANALADRPADDRGLEAWADWAGIAPRTMSRRFVAETGFTFTEWRQRIRLTRALDMLASGAAVTTVALDLGYDNPSAFIALFKRTYGITPAKWSARVRGAPCAATVLAAVKSGASYSEMK